MPWYYAEGALQNGPVPDEEFANLVRIGKVRADTLVWREGMGNWQPYSAVASADPALAVTAPPPVTSPDPAVAAAPVAPLAQVATVGDVVCHECGKLVSKENAIQYGTVWVCAGCKPLFVQKLREGTMPAQVQMGQHRYAGFWIRFAAKFIDGIIVGIVVNVPYFIFFFRPVAQLDLRGQIVFQIVFAAVQFALTAAYTTFFVGKFAATPGKMACSLRVVMADGQRVSYGRAFGRALAEILSGLTCYIGYIIAAFDEEKRSLHDHICSTRVVHK